MNDLISHHNMAEAIAIIGQFHQATETLGIPAPWVPIAEALQLQEMPPLGDIHEMLYGVPLMAILIPGCLCCLMLELGSHMAWLEQLGSQMAWLEQINYTQLASQMACQQINYAICHVC
ncbi:hypothetical protein A2U01_0028549 [Trifolium medium]|uniref:Uncharacterized protein n=1 Tax=Trifolium medium TaxID=97028 RepID=A0A392P7T9_9FABA|nr:hypothetical protein [Trifolium medium]